MNKFPFYSFDAALIIIPAYSDYLKQIPNEHDSLYLGYIHYNIFFYSFPNKIQQNIRIII